MEEGGAWGGLGVLGTVQEVLALSKGWETAWGNCTWLISMKDLIFKNANRGWVLITCPLFQSEGIPRLWVGQAYQLESPVGAEKTKPTLTLGPGAQSTPGCQWSNLLSF